MVFVVVVCLFWGFFLVFECGEKFYFKNVWLKSRDTVNLARPMNNNSKYTTSTLDQTVNSSFELLCG